jgi:carboxyl-terminal processing protease
MSSQEETIVVNEVKKSRGERRVLGYSLAFLFAIGAFFSGLQIGHYDNLTSNRANPLSFFLPASANDVSQPDLTEFWNVWKLLEEKYSLASSTEQVSIEDRIEGAISGLVDSYGDPYTVFLPPVEATQFEEDISGNFSGVGMEVGIREGVVTIIAPLSGTPAEKAGLLAGDIITKIDDTSTEKMSIDEAVRLIRGEKGTEVSFTVFREGEIDFLTITVTRDNIDIPTVKTEQVGDTFIISLYSFNALSEEKVRDALQEFSSSKSEKLVLDVRGNPGGYLQSAVAIASYFLPTGKVVVREQSGSEEERLFRTNNRQIREFTKENLVVLVDNGSASASEILAGALKDHGVGTIIGSPTFGKGSVQELVELSDGSSLKVTVARWFTPNGVSISDGGLAPDILIARTPAQRVAEEDPQRDAALRFLRGETVVSETPVE